MVNYKTGIERAPNDSFRKEECGEKDLPLSPKDVIVGLKDTLPVTAKGRNCVQYINEYMKENGFPNWYRGLSSFQVYSGFQLHTKLRDDYEQNSTHRVRNELLEIGISPIYPNNYQLRQLIHLSQAQDLAFLWFLWEWFYKGESPNSYTVNEQLLLSTIATLDTLTTIRELDRILPPPQPTKAAIRRRKELAEAKAKRIRERRKQMRKKAMIKYPLPYFEPLPIPQPYGKPLVIERPGFRVDMRELNKSLDADYKIPNEINRWFAEYKLNPLKRIATRILKDNVLGSNPSQLYDITSVLMTPYIRKTVYELFNVIKIPNSICEHHKEYKRQQELKRLEELVRRRDECLKMLDTLAYKREMRRRRILLQLEHDIGDFIKKYKKKLAKSCADCVAEMLSDTFLCSIHLIDEKCTDNISEKCEEYGAEEEISLADGDLIIEKYSSGQRICYDSREPNLKLYHDVDKCEPTSSTSNDLPKGGGYCRQYRKGRVDPIMFSRNLCLLVDNDMFNFGHNECSMSDSASSEEYFHATKEHVPFHMNYGKIFCCKDQNNESETDIKRYAVESLGGQVEKCKTLQDSPPKVDKAVCDYVKKTFKEGVALKNIELEEEEKLKEDVPSDGKLKFDADYFDPDDRNLMINMLKVAFLEMRKNPKFVLVTLPNAHLMPVMIEWISSRYGKAYSQKELRKAFAFSYKLFRLMDDITPGILRTPASKDITKKYFLSYKYKDCLIKKKNKTQSDFFNRCYAALMEQTRIYWFIMCPFLCITGPPLKTFFAYMPPRLADINIFRCWRSTEYKNYKQIRTDLQIRELEISKDG